jgi:hypothetical protein
VPEPDGEPVRVHSVQEEYFYLMLHPCSCGGPWRHDSGPDGASADAVHKVEAACHRCKQARTFLFRLESGGGAKAPVRQVNPTAEASRAIDVSGWLDLAQFYLGRIARLQDGVERAQSLLDARQCLEEALKFYGPADDGPPASAIWSDAGRAKAAANPAAFRRSKLEEMLSRMPPLDKLRAADTMDQRAFQKGRRSRARQRLWDRLKFWKK